MNILMILAHPDDEVIFGWPLLQENEGAYISLLTLSHNRAKYGAGPEDALKEVCETNGVQLLDICSRQETNFYRLPPRYTDLVLPDAIKAFKDSINLAIELTKPDFIFTHNPMGEYGHGDHRMLFNLVSMFSLPLLLTDICFENHCHLSADYIPDIIRKNVYMNALLTRENYKLNMVWHHNMRSIYDKHKAWSWGGHDAIEECNLYKFT